MCNYEIGRGSIDFEMEWEEILSRWDNSFRDKVLAWLIYFGGKDQRCKNNKYDNCLYSVDGI